MVVLALEMKYAVHHQIWRMAKLVVDDFLKILRVHPDDRFRQLEPAFDFLEPDFVMREVVGDRSGPDAFVANNAKIVQIERAIFEPEDRARFIHPRATKPRPLGSDAALPGPGLGIASPAVQGETNGRRPAPFPFREKI